MYASLQEAALHLHCIRTNHIPKVGFTYHEAPPKQEFHIANFLNPFTLEGGKNYKRQLCRQTPRVNPWCCSVILFDSIKQTPLQHGHSPSSEWGHWNETSSAVFLQVYLQREIIFFFFISKFLLFLAVKRLINTNDPFFGKHFHPMPSFSLCDWWSLIACQVP